MVAKLSSYLVSSRMSRYQASLWYKELHFIDHIAVSSTAVLLKSSHDRTDVMAWLLIIIRERSLDGVAYVIRHSIYQSIRLCGVVLESVSASIS